MARVIAGTARGLRLDTLRGDRTRPTSDRVKESLFSILTPHLPQAEVLDLFAGTGGLAIEALSRGAKRAVLVDHSKEALDVIRRNLDHTQLTELAEVFLADAGKGLRRLAKSGRRFDVIFIDPPYGQGLGMSILFELSRHDVLRTGGHIVVEHSRKEEMQPTTQNLTLNRQNRYGDTVISFYGLSDHQTDAKGE